QAAFEGRDELEKIKHGYEENRRILLDGLPRAGLDSFLPVDGAFYLYVDTSRLSDDSFDFAKRLLQQAGGGANSRDACRPVPRRAYRTTVLTSPNACSNRRGWRQLPASISIRFMAGITFAFATPDRMKTCAKRSRESVPGSKDKASGLVGQRARPVFGRAGFD